MKKTSQEFQRFDAAMGKLLQVPHSELKAKLDAEKASKKAKREKSDPKKHVEG